MKDLLVSRRFWAAVLVIVVVVVSAFSPDFDLNVETAAGLLVIITSYIVGVSVDPGPGGWRGIIASRKFWAALIGLLVLFLDAFKLVLPFQLTVEQLVSFAVVIGAYISGVAFERPKTNDSQPIELS